MKHTKNGGRKKNIHEQRRTGYLWITYFYSARNELQVEISGHIFQCGLMGLHRSSALFVSPVFFAIAYCLFRCAAHRESGCKRHTPTDRKRQSHQMWMSRYGVFPYKNVLCKCCSFILTLYKFRVTQNFVVCFRLSVLLLLLVVLFHHFSFFWGGFFVCVCVCRIVLTWFFRRHVIVLLVRCNFTTFYNRKQVKMGITEIVFIFVYISLVVFVWDFYPRGHLIIWLLYLFAKSYTDFQHTHMVFARARMLKI